MRVLHLSSTSDWRGGEQQIAYLIKGLEENNEVESFLLCKCKSVMSKKTVLPEDNIFTHSSIIFFFQQFKKLLPRIDIVHIHDNKSHTLFYLFQLLNKVQIPVVLSRRVDFKPKNSFFTKRKYNLPQIKKVICVSSYIKEVMGGVVLDKEKLAVIHSGVDIESTDKSTLNLISFLSEEKKKQNPLLIGTVAALEDHKDLFTFLKVVAFLKPFNKNLYFFIIGEGRLLETLKEEAKKLKIEENVVFIGFFENAKNLIAQMDVFLFTSKMEGLGTSVLDAMAKKIPIVSTNAGGLKDILIHRQNALISEVGDYVSLSNHLKELLENSELKNHLIEKAHKTVQNFSFFETSLKTYDLYKSLVR